MSFAEDRSPVEATRRAFDKLRGEFSAHIDETRRSIGGGAHLPARMPGRLGGEALLIRVEERGGGCLVTCEVVRTCLSDFFNGALPRGIQADIREHVWGCFSCAELYETLPAAKGFYSATKGREVPDADFSGYQFWLGKLNTFGDFRRAEMVKAFLASLEYRRRFGP